jgi:hypothetical protein
MYEFEAGGWQSFPCVGASLLAIAVAQLHSGWTCLFFLPWAPDLDTPSKRSQKKRRFPFLKEAPFF